MSEMRTSVESHESHMNNVHGHSNHNRWVLVLPGVSFDLRCYLLTYFSSIFDFYLFIVIFFISSFSNESGFVSVGHSEISTEHSFTSTFSSHHYSSHTDRWHNSTRHFFTTLQHLCFVLFFFVHSLFVCIFSKHYGSLIWHVFVYFYMINLFILALCYIITCS